MLTDIACYGGVGEIGGNKILVKFDKGSILLDFGLSYGKEADFFEEYLQPRSRCKFHDLLRLGLLPQINGIYRQDAFSPYDFEKYDIPGKNLWETDLESFEEAVKSGSHRPDAVFISHGHLDHCGYVPYLGDIPLMCSGITKVLLEAISDIGNLSSFDKELTYVKWRKMGKTGSGYFPGALRIESGDLQSRRFENLGNRKAVLTENGLAITGFDVGHSIPGSMACIVECDDTQILYTGDLRFHGRYGVDLRSELAGLKPGAMLCEGTRIDEEKPDNEEQVGRDLADLFSESDGLVMVGFAWKDLERYETVRDAALGEGRIPVFDPRLAYLVARLGRSVYDEEAKVFLERCFSMLYSPADYSSSRHKIGEMLLSDWSRKKDDRKVDKTHLEKGVSALDIRESPHSYVLHLDFFRFKNILDLDPPEGSVYVRAQCEPFNPRQELSEDRMKNWLKHFRINTANDFNPYQIHASGHASGPEIQEMIDAIKPRALIPVHTERPDLFSNTTGVVVQPVEGRKISVS